MSLLFTDKYNPKSLKGFVGNSEVVKKIENWAKNWKIGSKPLLLYGAPGIGKTLLAYLVAKEMEWQIFEINSSDERNKEFIENVVLSAASGSSLTGGKRLVLIDEIDVMFKGETSGYSGIIRLLKEAKTPVILTANDVYAKQQMAGIRNNCELVQMRRVNYLSIFSFLKAICEREEIDYVPEILKEMAQNSDGDVRAALLDLQTLACDGKISYNSLFSSRERKQDVFKIMNNVFYGKKEYEEYKKGMKGMDIEPEMFYNWLGENIPRQYNDGASAKAYEWLSKADVFEGRIIYRQYWGFRRYSIDMAGFGALLNKDRRSGWVGMQFPSYISYLSKSKAGRGKKKEIAEKLSEKMHSSAKDIIKSDFPFFEMMMQDEKFVLGLNRKYGLEEDEIAFLMGKKKLDKKVLGVLEKVKKEAVVVLDKNQSRLF